MVSLPRLVIAAPASGHGKTTIATGLMAALSAAGHTVSGHKVGPDYIDPGYHALATGKPGRNLDPHLVGEERLVPMLLHGATDADLAIIEGVMGLYDGQIGGDGFASTAHVATVTASPVVLVVDISHASRSIGAVVRGMIDFDPLVQIVGVILNKAGSTRHADEVCRALEPCGLPVLGVLQRDEGIIAPARHLGLVPADERDDAAHALDRLAAQIAAKVDLQRIVALARTAPTLHDQPWDPAAEVGPPSTRRPVVAIAAGRAFTFRYAETEELLRAAGCEVVAFDPLRDLALPERTAGIYLGGGFPEVHAASLSVNTALLQSIRTAVSAGVPTVAECAGLLYLCRSVDSAAMIGSISADAAMTPRLTLSYRHAVAPQDNLLAAAGARMTGHEFHRTAVVPAAGAQAAWTIDGQPEGFASATLHASYLHTHWAGHPQAAQRYAAAIHTADLAGRVAQGRGRRSPSRQATLAKASRATIPAPSLTTPLVDLQFHGDVEATTAMADFAVNVFDGQRPDWLDEALTQSLTQVGCYPDPGTAESAIARRYGRSREEVLATAGAAEAFTLIARMRPWRNPVVVHPQFTEPDVALLRAGHAAEHVILEETAGFTLGDVPVDADLVIVGNPTNPTSVLHPAERLRQLAKPGRILVVDEAFMDAVPDEQQSLAATQLPGVIVVRSLTKLWTIPGVRAGYLLAEPSTIEELRRQQTPWSVATTAAAAIVACMSDAARADAAARAQQVASNRKILVEGLCELGLVPIGPAAAPFVLVKAAPATHEQLRKAGYAVRRAHTFPGLGPEWVRIAVRRPDTTRRLLAALSSIVVGDKREAR